MPSWDTQDTAACLREKACQVLFAWANLDPFVLAATGWCGCKAWSVNDLPYLLNFLSKVCSSAHVIKLPFSLLGVPWVINRLTSEKAIGSHGQSAWVPRKKSLPAAVLNGPFPSVVLFPWIKSLRSDWATGMTKHGGFAWLFSNGLAILLSYQLCVMIFFQKRMGQRCRMGLHAGLRLYAEWCSSGDFKWYQLRVNCLEGQLNSTFSLRSPSN